MYEVSASVNDVSVIKIPLKDDFQIDIEKVRLSIFDQALKLIFICSPNNPTSNSMRREDVERIIANFKGIVIIDEAYSDFSAELSFSGLVKDHNNLIVMQTFSKAMGMAAVRVGMAFMDPEILNFFNKIKPPYNISTINQKAALARLDQKEEMATLVREIIDERERLKIEIARFGFVEKIYRSDSNFLLIKVNDANKLYKYLIDRNIIIRNRSSLIGNCVRITVGRKSENEALIEALEKYPL
jgi:histidinol-phosphate aminotransferase